MPQEQEPRTSAAAETINSVSKPWQFKPGNKSNPRGRPKGARNKITARMEKILAENAENLLQKAIELALADRGGPTLRALLPLLIAPLRERTTPVQCNLPALKTTEDLSNGLEAIAQSVRVGELDAEAIRTLTGLVEAARATIATTTADERMQELERLLETALGSKHGGHA